MKGHRRIIVAIGESAIRHRPPTGGYNVSCICGWTGGNWPNNAMAYTAYREHLDFQIDSCPIKCKRCGIEKPISQMRPDNRYICLVCSSQMGNEWQRKHPVEAANHKRNYAFLKSYGITVKEAEQLLAEQGGVCAICGELVSFSGPRAAHVDHDHISDKVRGILCFKCNVGLGSFDDDQSKLNAAIQYLRQRGRR